MAIVRGRDLVASPWKNGGGTTAEIAVAPHGAGLDAFDWRLSLADVASAGPFSSFPGIDRTLALVEGTGLDLTVDGEPHHLDAANPILAFAGEAVTVASLPGGPIRDINVMTRRGRTRHRMSIGEPGRHDDVAALIALDEPTVVRTDRQRVVLARFDTLLPDPGIIDIDRRALMVRIEQL